MEDETNEWLLVPRADALHSVSSPTSTPLLSAMVEETLAIAKSEQLKARTGKRKLGEWEFCDPDYRQILEWSKRLQTQPDEILRRLLDQRSICRSRGRVPFYHSRNETKIENGKIVDLNWDFDLLPITDFGWPEALAVRCLWITASEPDDVAGLCISPNLPELRTLECSNVRIGLLDLSGCPNLTDLILLNNFATDLRIPELPQLNTLWCSDAALQTLDLSGVPSLTELWLWDNRLPRLDAALAPRLKKLICFFGQLKNLDVSKLADLDEFWCFNNRLESLEFSNHSQLKDIRCINNALANLDISHAPELRTLWCGNNRLTNLDFSRTPLLECLHCARNEIEVLDIRPIENLRELRYDAQRTRLLQRADQKF